MTDIAARTEPLPAERVSFTEALRVWAKIGLLSFGGPAGQIALMHRVVVDEKKWVSEARFLHALNYCMLLPGPEAQQLATYLGWLIHGTRGGLAAGLLFILPGVAAIMALSIVYALYGQVGIVAGIFFGLKAAVLAIVLQAVVRIAGKALVNPAMVAIAAAAFIGIFLFAVPFPAIVLGAALLGYAGARIGHPAFASQGPPPGTGDDGLAGSPRRGTLGVALACLVLWLLPVALLVATLGGDHVFSRIAVFFSQMAVVTFGGAYAVLAYVGQQVVGVYGWLTPTEMLDGLGLAETTPGPLIMVLQFIGFLAAFRDPGSLPPVLAGAIGGVIATWVTFAPCFLWIFLGAPYVERLRGNRALASALRAITAAVVGVILNLAIWFAIHTIFRTVEQTALGPISVSLPDPASINPAAALLAAAAIVATFVLKMGLLPLLGAAACAGIVLQALGWAS